MGTTNFTEYVLRKHLPVRRTELRNKIGSGIILLPGNLQSPNNYSGNACHFRQDSSFRCYFGQNTPSLVGLPDADSGAEMLFGDDFTVAAIIRTVPQPTLCELGAQVSVTGAVISLTRLSLPLPEGIGHRK